MSYDGKLCISNVANIQPPSNNKTRKIVPLQGKRAHSLYFFVLLQCLFIYNIVFPLYSFVNTRAKTFY